LIGPPLSVMLPSAAFEGGFMRVFLRGAVCVAALVALSAVLAGAQQARHIDFWTISNYDYNPKVPFDPAPPKVTDTIPSEVRALEGRTIEIYGNAMDLDYSSGQMSEFILHSSADNCGFGAMPRINEWIHVVLAGGKTTRVSTALDVKVTGTFHIREVVEQGRVVGLYHIVADSVR